MATKAGSGVTHNVSYYIYTWTDLATGDDGAPVFRGDLSDKTVHVKGTFGGATVTIQGSMDGVTWLPLKSPLDLDGALAFTEESLSAILENPAFIRPVVTGGEGTGLKVMVGGRSRA